MDPQQASGPADAERLPTVEPRAPDTSADEKQERPAPPAPTFASSLQSDVSARYTDIPLLVCSFVSGLCDSVTVNGSNVFVSMQTGNTVFLALGTSGLPDDEPGLWLRSIVSIASFALGCFCFSKTRHLKPKRKLTLSLSFFVQSLAILLAAILTQVNVVKQFNSIEAAHASDSFIVLLPIGFLAWQFGGQISSSRMLGFGEVPTCVLTSVYCDLLSDPKLFAPLRENPKRNRRFMAVVTLLVGGIAGGWIQHTHRGMITVLWIAFAVKFALAVMWAFWKGDDGSK